MNLNIYYNAEYNAPELNCETFAKSRYIAKAIGDIPELGEFVKVKDPSERGGALGKAERLIRNAITPEYLRALMMGEPRHLAESNGFDWDRGVFQSVLNSTAGIICATDDVLGGYEQSCSLSSGLHHARAEAGAHFCTVNSLAIGAMYAASQGKRVAVLDLDAHFGGGTYSYAKTSLHPFRIVDLSLSDLDTYNPYPGIGIAIKANTNNYEAQLEDVFAILDSMSPEIVFYNAGVDVYPYISAERVVSREARVVETIRNIGAKTVIVMAGGYGKYENIVPLHLSTIMSFAHPQMLSTGLRVA